MPFFADFYLLYCKKNKLNHLNPIEFLDNKLHRTGIYNIKAKKELKKSFKILISINCIFNVIT